MNSPASRAARRRLTLVFSGFLIVTGVNIAFAQFGAPAFRTLFVYTELVALLLLIASALPEKLTPAQKELASSLCTFSCGTFVVWAVSIAIVYLVQCHRTVDGVDLEYFLCYARDQQLGRSPEGEFSYGYFPGVYRFWGVVHSWFGLATGAVQATVSAVIGINGALVACVVRTLTRSWGWGGIAFVLYVAIASRFEALNGTAETLGTIPYLAGILLWVVAVRQSHTFIAAGLLGCGLGFALWFKQQAGLLAIGACVFLLRNMWPESAGNDGRLWTLQGRFRHFFCVAAFATATFTLAILAESRGLSPLFDGLRLVQQYEVEGSWGGHILSLIRNDESLVWMIAVSVVLAFVLSKRRKIDHEVYRVTAFLVTSVVATLVQFRMRGYYHYALLAIPGLTIVFCTLIAESGRLRFGGERLSRCISAGLIAAALLPLAWTGHRAANLAVLSLPPIRISDSAVPWICRPKIVEQINVMRRQLPKDSTALVFPRRLVSVYRELNLLCPLGYSFSTPLDSSSSVLSMFEYIVVWSDEELPPEWSNQESMSCGSFNRQVEQSGMFTPSQSGSVTLWNRRQNIGREK